MQWWSVVNFVLSAMILTSRADPVINRGQIPAAPFNDGKPVREGAENRSRHPDPAAPFNGVKSVREGALLLLQDYMKQGDALPKERLKESISNLKELLQEEDAHLNERISEGLARLKEQLKEGDDRLNKELIEDVAWLKEKLAKGHSYLKEELEEGEMKTNVELTKLKEAFEKRQRGVKQSGSGLMDDLRQQVAVFQAELSSTKYQLQTTQTELISTKVQLQTELNTHQETLQSTRADLETTRADLRTTQADLQATQADLQTTQQKSNSNEEELQKTREQLHEEQQAFTALNAQLQTAEQAIRSLKVEMDSVQFNHDLVSSEMGSTFTRWGRTTCPDNTSLVYSGYVGGEYYEYSGGGSNYLCLVRDPQLDNRTLPAHYNYVHGTEYQFIDGQSYTQDALCSVCRAPQVTTLMIPATLSCPSGWTAQYSGHLVSGKYDEKGRNEFVCLDEVMENRDGGQANDNGALFYLVVTDCGPLPCPPYINNKVVTCVVCSK